MRDVQVQVLAIESSQTRTGKQMYSVALSNGEKVTTFDVALATKASQSAGQVVTARLEDVQKGNSTYHNLKELALPGEQLGPIIPQAGTPVAFNPGGVAPAPAAGAIPIGESSGGKGGFSEADKIRITKLAAISTAYAFVGQHLGNGVIEFEEAVKWADQLALKLYTDARSHEPGSAPQAPQVAQQPIVNAQDAAAAVNAVAGAPVVAVGTENVVTAAEPAALPWTTA